MIQRVAGVYSCKNYNLTHGPPAASAITVQQNQGKVINMEIINPSHESVFNNLIYFLNSNDYKISESRLENNSIFLIFNTVYDFNAVPAGFEMLTSKILNCDNCNNGQCCPHAPCNDYSPPLTILVTSKLNPFESASALDTILENLQAWAEALP